MLRLRLSPSGKFLDATNPGDVPGGVPPAFGIFPNQHKAITCTPDAQYTTQSTQLVLIAAAGTPGSTVPELSFDPVAQSQYPEADAPPGGISLVVRFNMQAELPTGSLPVVRLEVDNGVGTYSPLAGATHSVHSGGAGSTFQYALAGRILVPTNLTTNPLRARAVWASGVTNVGVISQFNSNPASLGGGGGWFFEGFIGNYLP